MITIPSILQLAREYRKDFKWCLTCRTKPHYCIPDSRYSSLKETRDVFIQQLPWYAPREERVKAIRELVNLYGE